MTHREAVYYLRRYRREQRSSLGLTELCRLASPAGERRFRCDFLDCVYEQMLVDELITRIKQSERRDPIDVVRGFRWWIDDILCDSEDGQHLLHSFASRMENLTGDILRYLKEIERRQRR